MRCVPHSLQHLKTWFILGGALWEGLSGGTLLEEVHFRGGGAEGIKRYYLFISVWSELSLWLRIE